MEANHQNNLFYLLLLMLILLSGNINYLMILFQTNIYKIFIKIMIICLLIINIQEDIFILFKH